MLTKVFRLDPDDRPPLKAVCLKGAKVAMIKTHVSNDAGPGTRGAWEKAGALLEGAGAVVEDVELPEVFKRCHEWQDIIVSSEVRVAFLSRLTVAKQVFNLTWTVLYSPTLNVRGFLGNDDLLVGLTVVEGRYADMEVLRIGRALDALFCGREEK
ncbi:hypothetical protein RJ55_06512 [Drechmeria coniospora]|nr:hypothetical protein RJ55_06512 [Drechmeria coniospora]